MGDQHKRTYHESFGYGYLTVEHDDSSSNMRGCSDWVFNTAKHASHTMTNKDENSEPVGVPSWMKGKWGRFRSTFAHMQKKRLNF